MTEIGLSDPPTGWKRAVGLMAVSALASALLVLAPTVAAAYVPIAIGTLALVALVRLLGPRSLAARRSLMGWTLAALALHVVVSAVMSAFFALQDDALYYHQSAQAMVDHWQSGSELPALFPGKTWYVYLLGGLYRLVGPYPAAGLAMNAVFAAGILPLVADVTERMFGPISSRVAAIIVLLYPGILVWTAMLNREAVVLLLIAIVLNAVVRLNSRVTPGALLSYAVALAVLSAFRPLAAATMGVGTLLGLGVAAKGPLAKAAAVASLPLLLTAGLMWQAGEGPGLLPVTAAQVDSIRALDAASSTSAIDADAETSGPLRATTFVVAHLPEAFAGPFPWHVRAVRHVLALPETAVWWCLLPALYVGLRRGLSQVGARVLVLVVPALTTQLALTYVVGDFGTLVRQRPQVVLPLVPLIAAGLTRAFAAREQTQPSAVPPSVQAPTR